MMKHTIDVRRCCQSSHKRDGTTSAGPGDKAVGSADTYCGKFRAPHPIQYLPGRKETKVADPHIHIVGNGTRAAISLWSSRPLFYQIRWIVSTAGVRTGPEASRCSVRATGGADRASPAFSRRPLSRRFMAGRCSSGVRAAALAGVSSTPASRRVCAGSVWDR